jgi:putative DNA primase/helicase
MSARGAPFLVDGHRRELVEDSAIDPAVVAERGYKTITRPSSGDNRARLTLGRLNIPTWATREDRYFPGLLIPMFGPTGNRVSSQWKPRVPVPNRDGKAMKYTSPRGQSSRLDVHPRNRCAISDPTVPLWITEGVKKADSLTSHGLCVVALTGVFNWRSNLASLGDWEDIPIKGREVTVCFDSDATTNPNVLRAMARLGRWLRDAKRAKKVYYLITPSEVHGTATKGADDFLAAGGTLADLMEARQGRPPNPDLSPDTYSDARLAETVSDEVLAGRFCWCKGLGWLGWDGTRWAEATDETVSEAVRLYALDRFAQAVEDAKSGDSAASKAALDGWRSMLPIGRRRAVISDAKGIVERKADEFDADPDLLNTPSGVVDLRTGNVEPHEPELLMTRITRGSYRPGYRHPDWEKALEALPEPEQVWYQARVGQAITGHPTPDGILVVAQGGGENGKGATSTDGVIPALGDYASAASSKLLASYGDKRTEHSTEQAELRGKRYLIAEEMTEQHALNVTALKQIQDVAVITARFVHRNNMTFSASHSLFATTNYVPVVRETDTGTWRRLALLIFPYRFRKPWEPLEGPNDRAGDLGLKPRIRAGETGQHDAVVTWAVEGALRVQVNPEVLAATVKVAADTLMWRGQADRVLGFWVERLVPDRKACVLTTELLADFNEWLGDGGHRPWPKELFGARFKGHSETTRHRVYDERTVNLEGLVRREVSGWPEAAAAPSRPVVYRGVRYRTPADDLPPTEDGENADRERDPSDLHKCDPLPDLPDPFVTSPRSPHVEKFTERSGRSGRRSWNAPPNDTYNRTYAVSQPPPDDTYDRTSAVSQPDGRTGGTDTPDEQEQVLPTQRADDWHEPPADIHGLECVICTRPATQRDDNGSALCANCWLEFGIKVATS